MTIIASDLLRSTGIVTCGMSTRQGGVSPEPFGMNLSFGVGDKRDTVEKNREIFFQVLGVPPGKLATPKQVHGNAVKYAQAGGIIEQCDGLITDVPGLFLGITVADCVPILVVDRCRNVVAAIHAGWRGTSAMIVQQGIETMIKEFRCEPGNMVANIGPCASSCCYVVGAEVAEQFAPEFCTGAEGRRFVDLKASNVAQLVAAGLSRGAIEISPHCTIHDAHLFHSYRRDGQMSGRMMAVIGLNPPPLR